MPKKHTERFQSKRIAKMQQLEMRGLDRTHIGERFAVSKERVRQILGNRTPNAQECKWCGMTFPAMRAKSTCCTERCCQNWRRYGLPEAKYYLYKFTSKIAPPNNNDCWEWLASCNPITGYGNTQWERKRIYTHRLMWTLAIGTIPADMYVLHKCDNPKCVNPHHLFLGTSLANAQDRESKGRGNRPHRFSMVEINTIRLSYQANSDLEKMAYSYGVSKMAIWNVVTRKTYRCKRKS